MAEVYQKIAEKIPKMSKAQEKIARYILSHPNSAPFLTVEKLANLSNVSIATVTRFVIFLGYKGYPEFLRDIQECMQNQVTKIEKIRVPERHGGEEKEKIIYGVFESDLNNIKSTIEEVNVTEIKKSVNEILQADRVYIIAKANSYALGVFLKYYLDFLVNDVIIITGTEILPKKVSEKDLIIGISFDKHIKSCVEVFKYLKEKGAKTLAITDNMLSPFVPYSDITLTATSKGLKQVDSFVAPLSLINALIVALEEERKDSFEDNIEQYEQVWQRFDLFM